VSLAVFRAELLSTRKSDGIRGPLSAAEPSLTVADFGGPLSDTLAIYGDIHGRPTASAVDIRVYGRRPLIALLICPAPISPLGPPAVGPWPELEWPLIWGL
jgi:hypothetical protein